jgi:signal peptidase II
MKALRRLLPALVLAMLLDGLTKIWAEQALQLHRPVAVLGDYFRLTLGYNSGVAFGMFANGGSGPLIVTGIVIVGLMIWFARALKTGQFPPQAGVPIGLLLGGAVANFADRLIDGQVTDFLDVGLGAARWPTFNLADSFIVVSITWLLFMGYWDKQHLASSTPPQDSTSLSEP